MEPLFLKNILITSRHTMQMRLPTSLGSTVSTTKKKKTSANPLNYISGIKHTLHYGKYICALRSYKPQAIYFNMVCRLSSHLTNVSAKPTAIYCDQYPICCVRKELVNPFAKTAYASDHCQLYTYFAF